MIGCSWPAAAHVCAAQANVEAWHTLGFRTVILGAGEHPRPLHHRLQADGHHQMQLRRPAEAKMHATTRMGRPQGSSLPDRCTVVLCALARPAGAEVSEQAAALAGQLSPKDSEPQVQIVVVGSILDALSRVFPPEAGQHGPSLMAPAPCTAPVMP